MLFVTLFLGVPCCGKFLVEFVNPACGVYELHFTREKRMGLAGNFQFDERILIAIFPDNRIVGGCAGAR